MGPTQVAYQAQRRLTWPGLRSRRFGVKRHQTLPSMPKWSRRRVTLLGGCESYCVPRWKSLASRLKLAFCDHLFAAGSVMEDGSGKPRGPSPAIRASLREKRLTLVRCTINGVRLHETQMTKLRELLHFLQVENFALSMLICANLGNL